MLHEHPTLSKSNLPSEGLIELGIDLIPNLSYRVHKVAAKIKDEHRLDSYVVNSTGTKVQYALTVYGIKLVFQKDNFGWIMTSPVVKVDVSKGHWMTSIRVETEGSIYELVATQL